MSTDISEACGIWVLKYLAQRPPDKWMKDDARLGQERRKRQPTTTRDGPRLKKLRPKSDIETTVSEAPMATDPLGQSHGDSPGHSTQTLEGDEKRIETNDKPCQDPFRSQPGSTHSRANDDSRSPAPAQEDLGNTRRLLFPSPRKEGEAKILSDVSINLVHTDRRSPKNVDTKDKERAVTFVHEDDMEDLFGPAPVHPSTPPLPEGDHGAFKTPNRPTPSHRPITRSVSRSMRSSRGMTRAISPQQAGQTPTPLKKRLPRNQHTTHRGEPPAEETPFTRSLTQLLSEAHSFTADSPSQAVHSLAVEFDMEAFPGADGRHEDLSVHDFSQFFSTDAVMPSSPPLTRHQAAVGTTGGMRFDGNMEQDIDVSDMWARFETIEDGSGAQGNEE